ncbi:MAG: hypothetical protein J0H65_05835 [Rhizobiales bacterium]|nr:hypothetical protein [Hyphomicrobiales bacterium]
MRGETQQRPDRIWTNGYVGWGTALALLALMIAGLLAGHATSHHARQVAGTVQSADWRLNGDTGQTYPFIEVKLDNGAFVRVGNTAPALPGIGDRVTLRQRAMLFDYLTVYEWDGPSAIISGPDTMTATPVSHP